MREQVHMEEPVREVKERIVRYFRDMAVLAVLHESGDGLNGYEIIQRVYEKLGILLPPGSLYPTLYSMERQQLVKGLLQSNSRVYSLTTKGYVRLERVGEMVQAFNVVMLQLFGNKAKQHVSI